MSLISFTKTTLSPFPTPSGLPGNPVHTWRPLAVPESEKQPSRPELRLTKMVGTYD
ncbi:hypothetical protein ACVWYF_003055 [Hymenobacter sp. UYAg731]